MGRNQLVTGSANVATQFGPEMGAAWAHEDADTTRLRALAISKTAIGSTYLAPSSVGVPVVPSNSWTPDELHHAGLLWAALRNWWDMEQALLARGIGPRLRALWWMQGEQDATGTAYSATYQANLQALWDAVKANAGYPTGQGLKAVIARICTGDPSMIYNADVRTAQAAFVTANSTEAALIDTDSYPRAADLVHYAAAGQKSLGAAFYAQTPLS